MKKINSFLTGLIGSDREFGLEQRLFNTISLLNGITNLVGLVGVLQLRNYQFLLSVQLITGLFFIACYYFSRFHNASSVLRWPFIVSIAVFIFVSAVYNNGNNGGTNYYIFPALMISIILSKTLLDVIFSLFLFFGLEAGLVLISVLRPQWIEKYANPYEQMLDVTGNIFFVELFVGVLVLVLAKNLNLERNKSDRLLKNILPESIAVELKRHDKVEPKEFEASILFSDFAGFTKSVESMTPQKLISSLDGCFSKFDDICRRHGLEKIKTIGDSYMAVGGIPNANTTHSFDCVAAALEMRDFIKTAGLPWNVRIGINSGPLVAGVIGTEKFAYDVWGDAVNVASRMESSGVENEVNISKLTYELIKESYRCEYRGKVNTKGKGETPMYLVLNKLGVEAG